MSTGATERRFDPSRYTLLLVDDDPTVSHLCVTIIERAGYQVRAYPDGESALEAFSAAPAAFHLAILDLLLPGIDGAEVTERIRALSPRLPVLVTSGFGATSPITQGDISAALAKPFRSQELLSTIERLLNRRYLHAPDD